MKVLVTTLLTTFALLLAAGPAPGELSRQDRKAAKAMFKDKILYMRTDAPCTQGRHPYGVYSSPVVDVSPEGVNLDAEGGASFGWFHAGSTVWEVRINDPVEFDELDFEDDTVEVELEGVQEADGRDTVIRFVDIRTLDDFRAAFDHAFSDQPLQAEYPDWPADIHEAIAARQLKNGMNKRQVYYVVGVPVRVEKSEEEGKKIEVWTLRKEGLKIGFWGMSHGDHPMSAPEELRFEDGLLTSAPASGTGPGGLDLDNP